MLIGLFLFWGDARLSQPIPQQPPILLSGFLIDSAPKIHFVLYLSRLNRASSQSL